MGRKPQARSRAPTLQSRQTLFPHISCFSTLPQCRDQATTLEALFTTYLETCAAVPREIIASLIQFAPTPTAEALLTKLSTDKTAYDHLASSTYLNLPRLLEHIAPSEAA
ncbi:hypothetical protein CLAFUW4_06694 [Fulvia fulva]|uniref:Uncharacterized protein n=1 Tax=Passalora fulva TaxID=5499 RepID=A0A9Q8PBJ9_PASFU|nr:uncharacterized protein CLAFUR5_06837 [Fulvia fulva]KAK4621747.1 hypothetical protein CLAFUR4_06702 [Fulvia fulva]KAK4622971.1 hypothetical protein CLAFUR0_06696 [Fulvia fulva]UJO19447.1 hypothetical protein CLAFUR5_06837 [Fulvia fulva]WPV15859.1 hypothetical protein CLAFUW4_06694 [Fulvia fulva]WPV31515.1 hypothetical protein CLAFUW7_06693 [Fulvia fulva]